MSASSKASALLLHDPVSFRAETDSRWLSLFVLSLSPYLIVDAKNETALEVAVWTRLRCGGRLDKKSEGFE